MSVLATYRRLARWPAGRWLFSRLVCWKAPYFASIAPRIEVLEPGRCVATIRHRRAVTNHLGTVHAIALCNLAEFTGGLGCDASLPPSMRWIPKGMMVAYLKKAVGTLRATATPTILPRTSQDGYDLPFEVVVENAAGEVVFRATIAMWVTPRG
jgi:acyl-coenzyme A thioesterase PaaI-like protein